MAEKFDWKKALKTPFGKQEDRSTEVLFVPGHNSGSPAASFGALSNTGQGGQVPADVSDWGEDAFTPAELATRGIAPAPQAPMSPVPPILADEPAPVVEPADLRPINVEALPPVMLAAPEPLPQLSPGPEVTPQAVPGPGPIHNAAPNQDKADDILARFGVQRATVRPNQGQASQAPVGADILGDLEKLLAGISSGSPTPEVSPVPTPSPEPVEPNVPVGELAARPEAEHLPTPQAVPTLEAPAVQLLPESVSETLARSPQPDLLPPVASPVADLEPEPPVASCADVLAPESGDHTQPTEPAPVHEPIQYQEPAEPVTASGRHWPPTALGQVELVPNDFVEVERDVPNLSDEPLGEPAISEAHTIEPDVVAARPEQPDLTEFLHQLQPQIPASAAAEPPAADHSGELAALLDATIPAAPLIPVASSARPEDSSEPVVPSFDWNRLQEIAPEPEPAVELPPVESLAWEFVPEAAAHVTEVEVVVALEPEVESEPEPVAEYNWDSLARSSQDHPSLAVPTQILRLATPDPEPAVAASFEPEIVDDRHFHLASLLAHGAVKHGADLIRVGPIGDNCPVWIRTFGHFEHVHDFSGEEGRGIWSWFAGHAHAHAGRAGSFGLNDETAVSVGLSQFPGGEVLVATLARSKSGPTELSAVGLSSNESRVLEAATRAPHGLIVVATPAGLSPRPVIEAVVGSWAKSRRMTAWLGAPPSDASATVISAHPGDDAGTALRGLLSIEPECLAIDDLNSAELAELAARAVEEGRLVCVGVRAASSWTAVAKLADAGFTAYGLSSCLRTVVSATAVRKLCAKCKRSHHLTMDRKARAMAVDPDALVADVWSATGCEECRGDGYDGYHVLREVIAMDDEGSRLVAAKAGPAALRAHFSRAKQKTMSQAALHAVLEGVTSWEEAEGHIS